MALTKDEILKIRDLKVEPIDIPEWGGVVYVRGMTGEERDKFESSIVQMAAGGEQKINMKNVRARMACYTLCDEDGNRLFFDSEINELAKKSALALQRIFEVAQRLSGIGQVEMDSLLKNSESSQADDFISG